MVDVITPLRLHLLQVVAKYPDIRREKLLTVKGGPSGGSRLPGTVRSDPERESGCYRISHLGQMALKRGL